MSRLRRYSELCRLETFEERFEYLVLRERVGEPTFGFDRWLNQDFYHSREWYHARALVIVRDNGCDLGIPGRDIHHGLLVHHMNPMVIEDILEHRAWVLNPDCLITTTLDTHNAIHYGDSSLLAKPFIPRTAGDTRLWQQKEKYDVQES
jgi:hypothetical protein